MRIYLDCEFNGFGGELISMAMVSEDGREFYSVLPEPRIWDKWVFENVFPVLNKAPVNSVSDFRVAFIEFLRGFDHPTIVADWPSDLVYFHQAMLGADHTQTIMRECQTELISCDYDSAIPHNALEDARAIKIAMDKRISNFLAELNEIGEYEPGCKENER